MWRLTSSVITAALLAAPSFAVGSNTSAARKAAARKAALHSTNRKAALHSTNRKAALHSTKEKSRPVSGWTPRERSLMLKQCFAKAKGRTDAWLLHRGDYPRPKGKRVPPGLDAYRGELHLCPPVKTGFVHIYKSAGSAVGKAFRRLCDLRHGANTSVLVHQKLTTLPLHDYKFFTFIRNPDQRFLSGVFECHRRRNLPASDLGGDPIDGTVLRHTPPAVFLRSVVARSLDDRLLHGQLHNAHLAPQVSSLVSEGDIMHSLTHIGRVENLVEDFVAIAKKVFRGAGAATQARKIMSGTYVGDRHDKKYQEAHGGTSDPVAALSVRDLTPEVKSMMERAYRLDYMCLLREHQMCREQRFFMRLA